MLCTSIQDMAKAFWQKQCDKQVDVPRLETTYAAFHQSVEPYLSDCIGRIGQGLHSELISMSQLQLCFISIHKLDGIRSDNVPTE